ncbi:unnamed protein product [Onchocerca flexuosa]|uniref:Helitron_like_N domain-containing protein n=1 Tax=Onchocerca flexuosa TaxID=387005 RepID=A0A183I0L6_9BILA|nr:unnamed protein product [Onchocerca flexuosa]
MRAYHHQEIRRYINITQLLLDRNAGVSVMFVTTDKSLAVKAMAHNIVTVDGNELFHLLITNSSSANKPRSAGSSVQSFYEFGHTVPVRHFYPKIRNNSQVLPKMFVRCSSPTFSPATFMHPPKRQFLVQNNGFSIQNRFCMPLWNEVSTEGPQILSPYAVQMYNETYANNLYTDSGTFRSGDS